MAENTTNVDQKVDTTAAEQIAQTPAPAPVEQAPKAKKENKLLAWCKDHKFGILAAVVSVITAIIGFFGGILFERSHPDDTEDCEDQDDEQPQWYDLTPADQTKEFEDSCEQLDFPNSTVQVQEEPIDY